MPRTGRPEYKAPTLTHLRATPDLVALFEEKLREAGYFSDNYKESPSAGEFLRSKRDHSAANGR